MAPQEPPLDPPLSVLVTRVLLFKMMSSHSGGNKINLFNECFMSLFEGLLLIHLHMRRCMAELWPSSACGGGNERYEDYITRGILFHTAKQFLTPWT